MAKANRTIDRSDEDHLSGLVKTHKPAVAKFADGDVIAKIGDKVFVRDIGESQYVCTITQLTPRRVFAEIDGEPNKGWYFPKKWNSFGHQPYLFADAHLWINK